MQSVTSLAPSFSQHPLYRRRSSESRRESTESTLHSQFFRMAQPYQPKVPCLAPRVGSNNVFCRARLYLMLEEERYK